MNRKHIDLAGKVMATMTDGPGPVMPLATALAPIIAPGDAGAVKGALDALLADDPNGPARLVFGQSLRRWDHARSPEWGANTEPNTIERRARILDLLQLGEDFASRCSTLLPPFLSDERPTIIVERPETWYTQQRRISRSYYWSKYVQQLREKSGWDEESVASLDDVTTEIVGCLGDPEAEKVFPGRGLVVGYVQSGKTANFTGVIARAADAGYRFIVVLAGTLDILRDQTQRRLDRELIGWELLGGDYDGEPETEKAGFLHHDGRPSLLGAFDWQRLTGPSYDYRSLRRGIEALEFPRVVPGRPFNAPENLHTAPARLLVVKKNASVLERLVGRLDPDPKKSKKGDLELLRSRLEDVPALIIDDESDQAGINTMNPQTDERTRVNAAIHRLLTLLPRGQYIGYTATPFANVFVDPDDRFDIFPRDFIISLGRPRGYMGISDFFDLGDQVPPGFLSKKEAHIRDVRGDDTKPENLQRAIDSFVLAGAIKLFREDRNPKRRFRHHTMLVHTSHLQDAHEADADVVRQVFEEADYEGGDGIARLHQLYEMDFLPVHDAQAPDLAMPARVRDIEPFIGEVLSRINADGKPVLIVNGDNKDDTPDFEKRPVWNILVGGTKLSRGYTVEGLTVSYYRRKSAQADTLMQMGRWFGFRRGYQDLVRLFIGREESDRNGPIDLYAYFRSICQDEEAFRLILQQYSREADPRPRPIDVPPLVPSHLLLPTARNKMYHAKAAVLNVGGEWKEPTMAPTDPKKLEANLELLRTRLLKGVMLSKHVLTVNGSGQEVLIGRLTTEQVLEFLDGYQWSSPTPALEAERRFMRGILGDTGITGWTFLAPQLTATGRRQAAANSGQGPFTVGSHKFDVYTRSRIDGSFRIGAYSDPKHRPLARYLAGVEFGPEAGDDEARRWRSETRGVFVFYPTSADGKQPLVMGFALQFPMNSNKRKFGFINEKAQP